MSAITVGSHEYPSGVERDATISVRLDRGSIDVQAWAGPAWEESWRGALTWRGPRGGGHGWLHLVPIEAWNLQCHLRSVATDALRGLNISETVEGMWSERVVIGGDRRPCFVPDIPLRLHGPRAPRALHWVSPTDLFNIAAALEFVASEVNA